MKNRKRLVSAVLTFCMVLCMMPIEVHAVDTCPHTNVEWHTSKEGYLG